MARVKNNLPEELVRRLLQYEENGCVVKREKKMEPTNNVERKPIYFSMNVPDWFMNIPSVEEKCAVIEDLEAKLRDVPPISEEQRKKLFKLK
jgi:hypothetical protein